MSEFFEADYVRDGLQNIHEIQEEVQDGFLHFHEYDDEEKAEHLALLDQLIEKQQLMYVRMKLSDDPGAKKIVKDMRESLSFLGLPKGVTVETAFSNMRQALCQFKRQEVDIPDDT
jgi:hypothetical protein